MAATTSVEDISQVYGGRQGEVFIWNWTSDGSGDVDSTHNKIAGGRIRRVVTEPGGTTPTNLYDVTLYDSHDVDLSGTNLDDCSNSSNEDWVPSNPILVSGKLRITVANAGSSKTGTIRVYVD